MAHNPEVSNAGIVEFYQLNVKDTLRFELHRYGNDNPQSKNVKKTLRSTDGGLPLCCKASIIYKRRRKCGARTLEIGGSSR